VLRLRWLKLLSRLALKRPLQAAACVVAVIVLVAVGVIVFAWSGLYNVAASHGHWYVVDRFLRFGMENSVRARAPDVKPPALDDPDLVRLGGAHYHGCCAFCHGAPGSRSSPIVQTMLPPPPDLQEQVPLWTNQELFWLVKHGLKYAGMPAWPAQDRDDEVWAVVAFLRRLPGLDPAGYESIALGGVEPDPSGGRQLATAESSPDAVGACARCHGSEGQGPTSALVPRLAGQSVEWLTRALHDYAAGARHSGIMQPLAAALSPRAVTELAQYYAGLPPSSPEGAAARASGSIENGRRLATDGDAAAELPACLSCHGPSGSREYPRLAGQPARYLSAQLMAWRGGKGGASATHAIMAPIARRLNDRQIADVSAFFASLSPVSEEAGRP
jgi:cytochrome c553